MKFIVILIGAFSLFSAYATNFYSTNVVRYHSNNPQKDSVELPVTDRITIIEGRPQDLKPFKGVEFSYGDLVFAGWCSSLPCHSFEHLSHPVGTEVDFSTFKKDLNL